MKKVVMGIVLLAVIVAGGFYAYQTFFKKTLRMEDVLPAGPLAYVKVQNLEENLVEFTSTGFWKHIQSIDYEKAAASAPDFQNRYLMIQKFLQNIFTRENKHMVMDLLGDEFAVAMYPEAVDQFMAGNMSGAIEHLIFVTRLSPRFQIQEAIAGISQKFAQDPKMDTKEYKGHEIHLLDTGQGIQVGYTRVGDYLVVGMGDQAARAAIDRGEAQEPALAGDPKFQTVQARFLPDAETIVYLDVKRYTSYLESFIGSKAAQSIAGRQQVQDLFRQWSGFQAWGYSGRFGIPLSAGKTSLQFDPNQLDPRMRSFYECSPDENRSLKMIPVNILVYEWAGCDRLEHYWRTFQEELEKNQRLSQQDAVLKQIEAVLAGIEQTTGLNIEKDILGVLGNESGYFLLDVDSSGAFPLPNAAVFVELTDRDKAQEVVGTLLNQYAFFQFSTENYGRATITYAPFPFLPNLEPSYTVIGDYLVLATKRDVVRAAIDAFEGRAASLNADSTMKSITPPFLEPPNRSMGYLRLGGIAQELKDVLKWADQWMSIQEKKQLAFKAGTRQRLKDIEQEIAARQEDLRVSQQRLSGLEREVSATAFDEQELRTKIVVLQERLAAEQSVSPAAAEGEPVPEISQEEIAETRMSLLNLQKKFKDKQRAGEEIQSLREEIKKVEHNLEASLQIQAQLQKIIEGYQDQMLAPRARQILTDEIVMPVLKAFESLGPAAGRSIIQDQTFESYFYTTFR